MVQKKNEGLLEYIDVPSDLIMPISVFYNKKASPLQCVDILAHTSIINQLVIDRISIKKGVYNNIHIL